MTNRQRLEEAKKLLEEATGSLNKASHKCPTCHLTVREDWSQEQAATTLSGLVKKIDRTLEAPNLQPWLDLEV